MYYYTDNQFIMYNIFDNPHNFTLLDLITFVFCKFTYVIIMFIYLIINHLFLLYTFFQLLLLVDVYKTKYPLFSVFSDKTYPNPTKKQSRSQRLKWPNFQTFHFPPHSIQFSRFSHTFRYTLLIYAIIKNQTAISF